MRSHAITCAVIQSVFGRQCDCMCGGWLKRSIGFLSDSQVNSALRVGLVLLGTLCKERARSLHQRAENQSGRFTVGPFAMSGLLQLFVIPCQGSSALSTAQGLLGARACGRPGNVYTCVCMYMCVLVCLFACVLEGNRQGGALLIWASLQAMPRAKKQETTGRVVCGTVWTWERMCLYVLLVWHRKNRKRVCL